MTGLPPPHTAWCSLGSPHSSPQRWILVRSHLTEEETEPQRGDSLAQGCSTDDWRRWGLNQAAWICGPLPFRGGNGELICPGSPQQPKVKQETWYHSALAVPAKPCIRYLCLAALAGGGCYLPHVIDEETEVQGIWVIWQVTGSSDECGPLIMILDPAHPFLSVHTPCY